MKDRTHSDFITFLSSTPEEFEDDVEAEAPNTSSDCRKTIYGNVQIFSDHLKTSKRFQKTLYYGDLLPSNFHPPLTLTDATLELFNKTVPNACRLDILDLDYATTVSKTVCISPYSMVLAIMYLEQLRHKNPDYLENVSPCDLYVVSILVASKYLFDNDEEFTYNYDWADAANIDIQELNRLEKEFLDAMDWQLYTKPSEFFSFLSRIEGRIAYKQSLQRGWFSYSEILVLCQNGILPKEILLELSNFVVKVVLVVTVSYACAVYVIYAAVAITSIAESFTRTIINEIIHTNSEVSSIYEPLQLSLTENIFSNEMSASKLSGFESSSHQLAVLDMSDDENGTFCNTVSRNLYNSPCDYSQWKKGIKNDTNCHVQLFKNNVSEPDRLEFFLPVSFFEKSARTKYTSHINCSSINTKLKCNYSIIVA